MLAAGRALGQKIGTGRVRVVHNLSEMDQVQPGDFVRLEVLRDASQREIRDLRSRQT